MPDQFSIEVIKAADAFVIELNKEKTQLLERIADIDEILEGPFAFLVVDAGQRKQRKRGPPSKEERAKRSAALKKESITLPEAILRVIRENPGIMAARIYKEVTKIRPAARRSISPQVSILARKGKIVARGTSKKFQYYAK